MRRLGALGITLIGLLAIAQAFALLFVPLGSLITGAGERLAWQQILLYFTPFALEICFGAALVAWRDNLSVRWFDDSAVDLPGEPPALLQVGLVLIGVFVTVTQATAAFVGLTNGFSNLGMRASLGPLSTADTVSALVPTFVAHAIGVALGVALIVFARPLANRMWPTASDDA